MINLSPLDRHEKVALSLSCGKDSLACLYLLRDHLSRLTVYFHNTGDLMPETAAVADKIEAMCPNFVRTTSDVRGWIAEYGLPTDLLPYSEHAVASAAGQNGAKLVTRYHCCFVNLMWPVWNRIKADGNTLCIRGTKLADQNRLPARSGEIHEGVEIWHPIEAWSHEDVQTYLREVDAPHNPIYDAMTNAPECARCSAWWGEGRAAYLRERHPELFADYARDLRIVAGEIAAPLADLQRELAGVG
jgi:phosphoadenosine phosphosulfate reductase